MLAERADLTIDELARLTGMSARNIRAHQSRGLLAPPTLRGRTGYYSAEHVDRVQLIQELQSTGFSLDLIGRLLTMTDDSTEEVRRFTSALRRPFGDERPQVVAQSDLQQRFSSTAREPLERVLELGFLRALGDGRFEEVTPQAWRGAEVFAELGVPVEEIVAVAADARGHIDAIAAAFMTLFVEHVWKPFEVAGRSEEGLERVFEAIERLRPLASATVQSLFQLAMGEAAEKRLRSELARLEQQRS
ncbi:MAG TPA: MerR family transcriptional regulator [Solirubrobacteraceae bacterium]|jgi:DNA-binding transcriptional MerR regulator|nr:MerR family transcriptional regulator [Solirubrobacteraceae bacterium]